MANSRLPVPAPEKSPLGYGLFSVAENRSDPVGLRGHWKSGVEWQNVCPDANTTYDACVSDNSVGPGSDLDDPDSKAATADRTIWGATPFTVFVEIDCSPPGFWENADEILARTFGEAEMQEVEETFWTGTVAGVPNVAFPHLAGGGSLTDGGTTLQLLTANVGPTGFTPLDVVEAFGKLEQALSECVKGEGVIHMPAELLAHAVANHLITERNGVLYSPNGHKIAVSAGYPGSSPSGTTPTGAVWMYGTGPVFMYRSRGRMLGNNTAALDRSVDTLKKIFERTYVIGYDCCLFGLAVSTGGVTPGTSGG